MKKEIELSCYKCNKKFKRSISLHRLALRRRNKPHCSQKCAHETANTKIKLRCLSCNKKIFRTKAQIDNSKTKRFFCSHSCSAKVTNNSKTVFGRSLYRNLALNSFKNACSICDFNILEALVVHHIDENRNNNTLNNLCILCLNCHKLVHKNKVSLPKEVLGRNI